MPDCPAIEPLCEKSSNSKQQIYTNAQRSSQEMPPCPAIEPLCEKSSNSKQQIYTNAQVRAAPETTKPVEKCEAPIEVSEVEMNSEMDYFSRKFDMKHYLNAMHIFTELKKQGYSGKAPKITTWELYDKAFTFQQIRNYSGVA